MARRWWTPRFEAIFDKAGMKLDDALNKIAVPGHKGPHPEAYHQAVFRRLESATSWLSGSAYRYALQTELGVIGREIQTPGSVVEGAGGRTYVVNPANPGAFTSAGRGSSVYAEFDVPTSVLKPGSKPEWAVIPGPNVTTRLYGPAPTELAPATCIVCVIGKP